MSLGTDNWCPRGVTRLTVKTSSPVTRFRDRGAWLASSSVGERSGAVSARSLVRKERHPDDDERPERRHRYGEFSADLLVKATTPEQRPPQDPDNERDQQGWSGLENPSSRPTSSLAERAHELRRRTLRLIVGRTARQQPSILPTSARLATHTQPRAY